MTSLLRLHARGEYARPATLRRDPPRPGRGAPRRCAPSCESARSTFRSPTIRGRLQVRPCRERKVAPLPLATRRRERAADAYPSSSWRRSARLWLALLVHRVGEPDVRDRVQPDLDAPLRHDTGRVADACQG